MYLFCDSEDCKYHDPEINRCRENNYKCPYQKELREKENNIDATETIIKPLFDAIDLEKSEAKPVDMPTVPDDRYIFGKGEFPPKDAIIKQPKVIARVSMFGEGIVFNIMDTCKGFVKPTKKHIKNLKKYFGIDVKLFDDDNGVKEFTEKSVLELSDNDLMLLKMCIYAMRDRLKTDIENYKSILKDLEYSGLSNEISVYKGMINMDEKIIMQCSDWLKRLEQV